MHAKQVVRSVPGPRLEELRDKHGILQARMKELTRRILDGLRRPKRG